METTRHQHVQVRVMYFKTSNLNRSHWDCTAVQSEGTVRMYGTKSRGETRSAARIIGMVCPQGTPLYWKWPEIYVCCRRSTLYHLHMKELTEPWFSSARRIVRLFAKCCDSCSNLEEYLLGENSGSILLLCCQQRVMPAVHNLLVLIKVGLGSCLMGLGSGFDTVKKVLTGATPRR